LVGAIAVAAFEPVAIALSWQPTLVAIPEGATTVDLYNVGGGTDGGNSVFNPDTGTYSLGAGGIGGACDWATDIPVAGHSFIYGRGSTAPFLWDSSVLEPGGANVIPLTQHNSGGSGSGGVGGGAATEMGPGLNDGSSPTAGSVLAPYVGHGGSFGSSGVGWGAGGGGGIDGGQGASGQSGGSLLIFK